MSDFITLSCPNCGGKLNITNDLERFACGYCGMEQVVIRGGKVISLKPVVEKLTSIQGGVDKTASELAIKRLNDEIRSLEYQIQSTYPKIESGTSNFLRLTSLFGIFVSLFFFWKQETIIYGIVGIIFCIVMFIRGNNEAKVEMEIYKAKITQFNKSKLVNQLNEKKEELAKHQKIVSS